VPNAFSLQPRFQSEMQRTGVVGPITRNLPVVGWTAACTRFRAEVDVKHLKRVLCAVDIDERHRQVFAHALSLARRSDASLLIVHAASPVRPFNEGATERVDFLRQLHSAAEAAGVDVRVTVQRGDVAGVILLHAAARHPDLIVLGAGRDRRSGINSIAEQVVREATCPTLVIPDIEDLRPATFESILCAVDLSAVSRTAAEKALRLGEHSDRRVTLFHVVEGPTAEHPSHYPALAVHEHYRGLAATALEQLQDWIPAPARGLVLARVAVGNPVEEILRTARSSKADLVVIGAQPRSISRRLFGRTGLLLRQASCPVLAIPRPPHASADEPEGRRKVAA
jgi:nucleotide-binding universal stress UspA family protein